MWLDDSLQELCLNRIIFLSVWNNKNLCFFQTLRSPSKLVGRSDSLPQVDARYPAILFKQQLTACVEKIFGQLRDNLKKEISPLLNVCIQVYNYFLNMVMTAAMDNWVTLIACRLQSQHVGHPEKHPSHLGLVPNRHQIPTGTTLSISLTCLWIHCVKIM